MSLQILLHQYVTSEVRKIQGDSVARGPKLFVYKKLCYRDNDLKNFYKHTENDARQDLLVIDAETGLLSHPSTLECVSPNSGIHFPNLFGTSSERITL